LFTSTSKHHLYHISGNLPKKLNSSNNFKIFEYPSQTSPYFILPNHPEFHYSTAALAHTRTLSFMKPLVGGPYFDLESIWEDHTRYEFEERSVARTMATMVGEPYVNHVPTVS